MFVKEIRSGALSREKGLLMMSPKECYYLNQTLEIWKELIQQHGTLENNNIYFNHFNISCTHGLEIHSQNSEGLT